MSCIARWLIQVFTYRCGDRRALGGEHSGKHDIASMESLDQLRSRETVHLSTWRLVCCMWDMEVGRLELGRPQGSLPSLMLRAQRQCGAERHRIQCMRRRWVTSVARRHRSRTPAPSLRRSDGQHSDTAADLAETESFGPSRRGWALLSDARQSGELHGSRPGFDQEQLEPSPQA